MSEIKTVSLLRGDDLTHFKQVIRRIKDSLGNASMAELNTKVLDGEATNLETLTADCMAMPFLTEKRLVVIERANGMLAKVNKEEQPKWVQFLEQLPETSLLVLLVEDTRKKEKGQWLWESAKTYDWLLKWVKSHPGLVELIDCSLPDQNEMPAWIRKQAKSQGGEILTNAASLLANYVGNNTLRAEQEITKLLTYAGARAVTSEDVVLLTSQEQEGNIFNLTDAIGERDGAKALTQFRLLSVDNNMVELAPMIHRQFRLLIQVREILDEKGSMEDIKRELRVPDFLVPKLTAQARRFNMPTLLRIFERLLKIDEDMKGSGMPGDLAFELLIADLTR